MLRVVKPMHLVYARLGTNAVRPFSTTRTNLVKTLKNGLPAAYTFGQSFWIWLEFIFNFEDQDQVSQDTLYKQQLPYYRDYRGYYSDKGLNAYPVKTIINADGDYINELRVENNSRREDATMAPQESEPHKHLVMLHGYAASAGWFFKNVDGLVKNNPNSKVHVLDQLGFGLSSRPDVVYKYNNDTDLEIKFDKGETQQAKESGKTGQKKKKKSMRTPKTFKLDPKNILKYIQGQREMVEEVEEIYVESLEKWRENNGLDKFDLLGHSFGGYVSLCYALKYPQHVNKLVLVSPGGVERTPFAVENPEYKKVAAKPNETDAIEQKTSMWVGDYNFLGRFPMVKDSFRMIWHARLSPFTMLRWAGPWGPKLLSERNFNKLTRSGSMTSWDEIDKFIKYVYYTGLKPSFSETSLMRIFDSSVVAKFPLLDRLKGLKVKSTMWIYGEHDFMFTDCGRAGTQELKERGLDSHFTTVSNAGHNLYLDNPAEFNAKVLKFLGWNGEGEINGAASVHEPEKLAREGSRASSGSGAAAKRTETSAGKLQDGSEGEDEFGDDEKTLVDEPTTTTQGQK